MSKIKNIIEIRISGNAISSGIAIGKPYFLKTMKNNFIDDKIKSQEIANEIKRFRAAVKSAQKDLREMIKQMNLEGIDEGSQILDSQLMLLSDPSLIKEAEKRIQNERKKAEFILQKLTQEFQEKFEKLEDVYFRERIQDIQDVTNRVIGYLYQATKNTLPNLAPNTILFAEDISPSETAEATQKQVKAIVSERGSPTAHAAILARAKEIPYMTNISLSQVSQHSECVVIVDGRSGQLIINPTLETLKKYEKLHSEISARRDQLSQMRSQKIETFDGYQMRLMANIESCEETDKIHQFGGNGIGLYRSENILVGRNTLPSEQEQFEIYCAILEKMKGLPTTVRTFDVGRDKAGINPTSGNSFFGFRAVANLKREKDIFMTQLRALYRASAYGELNILFPMVSSLQELLEAKQMVKEVAKQIKTRRKIKIGCMIEVPSAAIISDLLAKECDFLSIGTNDLIQYTLAVDRCDHLLSHLYQPAHPCVLRLIQHVVAEGNRYNVPVSICGEMAANPKFTHLLLGLGVRELSVAARYIPLIRETIRSTSIISCYELAAKALTLPSAIEIQALLEDNYNSHFAKDYLNTLL